MNRIIKKLKNYLFTGLLVWLPIALTIWVIELLIRSVDQIVPHKLSGQALFGVHIPGMGLIFAFGILLTTGIVAKNIFGIKIINFWDKIILQIPIVKSIYKGIKQVSDTLLSGSGNAFRKALLVRFPNSNSWTVAFITGSPSQNILENFSEYINVYVPTTPNPTSGYFIIVHKSDIKELKMTVDEALRYVISMGALESKK
ncbi:MAG TPA: DUF502 domain-containing protein [Burkholderiales bacterium]|nr:DUF502 domain-containing protein [Burkholderiales bacterium]